MTNYQARLDRLEAAIAPDESFIVVLVMDGQTNEDALAAYAERRGIKPGDIRVPVIYISETDSVL